MEVLLLLEMEEEMEEKMMVEFGVKMVEMVSGKDGSVAGQRRAMAANFSLETKIKEEE